MKNIKILDCTLRDGGRIIDCKFHDRDICDITKRLTESNIDIVEVGFLRDKKKVNYAGNSTFFTCVDQIVPFLPENHDNTMYVAFIDYGMFDFDTLKEFDGTSIDGIRVGFTKNDYKNNKTDIIHCLNVVKKKGYKLFIQGVNSLGYSDKELLEIVELVNEIHPYGFGIVDTYGAMYIEDVRRIYGLVDNNMFDDIAIDFHSHNNYQLSFALAQEVISLAKGNRNIIIDATLNGMGKCAGNLNTELIVEFLNRKHRYNYDFDEILDIIDEYMYAIKEKCSWGYSIPAMMAGIYKSHPNNVIYLTEKFRLSTKDIKYIISMISPEVRQRYDYDNIQNLYRTYNHTKVDDRDALRKVGDILKDRNIVVLFPGASLNDYNGKIEKYIKDNNALIVSVNFVSGFAEQSNRIAFFGSEKRYKKAYKSTSQEQFVIVSNIDSHRNNDIIINYERLVERGNEDFDNTAIMLFNFLRILGISSFAIAGFDGFKKGQNNYFDDSIFESGRFNDKCEHTTNNVREMLKEYAYGLNHKDDIVFLTPSVYEDIFVE